MALHLLHGPVPVSRQSPIVGRRGAALSLRLNEPDPTQVRALKVPGSQRMICSVLRRSDSGPSFHGRLTRQLIDPIT